ncbi:MAG: hypothetical protein LAP87_29690 [Acidobacteriia bacterium]|nr:hypothetical protein [Terriglobia bacterium]
MRARRWLVAIWFCFLARAFFYCAVLPLWEGFDEWSHFGVVQRMAFRGEPLVSRDSPLPGDAAASLDLVPLPWELRNFAPPSATHDVFWRLPPAERARRESLFRAISPAWALQDAANLKTYEGLQGPLYGWIMTPVLLAARHAHLATQVLLLRWFGVTIVSLVIPFSFFACRRVFRDPSLALGCAAVIAAMPGLLIDAAHVSNESVAVVLFTLLIWVSLEIADRGLSLRRALSLGAVLGLGLLAKAYFLAALPPVFLLLAWKCRRDRHALLVPLATAAIAGWWYVRNLLTTGAASGMWESATLPNATFFDQIRQITRIHWGVVVDSIMFSHLWLGSWSTLTVRSWMYHLLYLLIALAAAGLAWDALRPVRTSQTRARLPAFSVLAMFFVAFWMGQLYHAITLFMVWGIATTLGSYLYAVVTAEVALSVAGLRALVPLAARSLVAPFGVAIFALLDLYTIHFICLPYYAGLIAHRPGGFLATFHVGGAGLAEVLARLHAFKSSLLSEPFLAALWIAYLGATAALAAIAYVSRSRGRTGDS